MLEVLFQESLFYTWIETVARDRSLSRSLYDVLGFSKEIAVPIQRGAIRTNHFWIVVRDYLVACPFILHRLGLCFNLEKPNLTDSLQPDLSALVHLETLDLSRNKLTGSIPVELGSLASLTIFNVSQNKLSGAIPPELGSGPGLQALESLDLSFNILTGSIPNTFNGTNFSNIQMLNLGNNALKGEIPASITTLSFPSLALYVEYNQLTATSPTLITFLDHLDGPWAIQMIAPADFKMIHVSQAGVTLTWTTRTNLGILGGTLSGGYEVNCAVEVDGVYATVGVISGFASNSLLIPHFAATSLYYCKIHTYGNIYRKSAVKPLPSGMGI